MIIQIKKLNEKALLPKRYSEHAAGYDICACLDKDMTLAPKSIALIPTGLAIAIDEGYEVQVRPRSGLALKHQIGVLNSPGTIDPDYRGEVKVILYNFSDENFTISNKMRIAQIVVSKYESPDWVLVEELSETGRGQGGFGHTKL